MCYRRSTSADARFSNQLNQLPDVTSLEPGTEIWSVRFHA